MSAQHRVTVLLADSTFVRAGVRALLAAKPARVRLATVSSAE
jgi:hypothetical protein